MVIRCLHSVEAPKGLAMAKDITFDEWWAQVQGLAILEGIDLVGDQNDYREYYEDGDSPEKTIDVELTYIDEDHELEELTEPRMNGKRYLS